MRFILRLLLLAMVSLALSAAPAPAMAKDINVTLTQDQVATVCGKKLETDGNVTGCTKLCYNNHLCRFECNGSSCYGYVALLTNPANGGRPKLVAPEAQNLGSTVSSPGAPTPGAGPPVLF